MLSVIILDSHEPSVINLTYENLWKELKDIPGAELIVSDSWLGAIPNTKNKYVCFVEADCLVNSGYFTSQMALFEKNKYLRKLAMLSSATAVNFWPNRFFGYSIGNDFSNDIIPQKFKHSSAVYPLQIGYVPGSIIRKSMLEPALKEVVGTPGIEHDIVLFSTLLSIAFWGQGDGNRVHINPNTTYVTTESYVNDLGKFGGSVKLSSGIADIFRKECI